jgi:hypothetical protein
MACGTGGLTINGERRCHSLKEKKNSKLFPDCFEGEVRSMKEKSKIMKGITSKMKKIIVFVVMAFAVALASAETLTSIKCDDLSNWTTENIAAGDTFTATMEGTDFNEGTGSIKVNYVSGSDIAAWNRSCRVTYNFASPINLEKLEYMTFWTKTLVGASVATSKINLQIDFVDENNLAVRYVYTGVLKNTAWAKKSIRLCDLETNIWLYSGKNPNLTKIKQVRFDVSQAGALVTGNQLTFLLDNIQFTGNTNSLNEQTVADFESWTATDASNLQPAFARTGTTYSVLMNEGAMGTSKSLKVVGALAGANSNYGVKIPLTQVSNFSQAVYFRAAIKGLSAYTTITPVMSIFLVDTAGNRAVGMAYGVIEKEDGFRDVFFKIKNKGVTTPANSDTYGWYEDNYDAGGSTGFLDYSAVSAIWLGIKGVSGSYDTTEKYMIVDEIKAGFAANYDSNVDMNAVTHTYTTHNVATAPTIDGVANVSEWPVDSQALDAWADSSTGAVPYNLSFKVMNDNNNLYVLLVDVTSTFATNTVTKDDSSNRPGDQLGLYFLTRGNDFPNSTDPYHTILLPNLDNGTCYVWDEKRWGGTASWTASNDKAAFTYSNNTLVIEYQIPYTDFNNAGFVVNAKPDAGTVWGLQVTSSLTTGQNICWYGEAGSYAGLRPMPGVLVFGAPVSFANATTVVTLGQSKNIYINGGSAPFTWSFSSSSTVLTSAQGSISSSTTDTVVFTASALGTVQLYCTDNLGNKVSGFVSVIPTEAPLAKDWSLME